MDVLCRYCASCVAPSISTSAPAAAGSALADAGGKLGPASQLSHSLLMKVLATLAPALRSCHLAPGPATDAASAASALSRSRLPDLSAACVRRSLALPPVTVDPSPAGLAALQLSVACFPINTPTRTINGAGASAGAVGGLIGGSDGSGIGLVVDPQERQLLVALLKHQAVRHAGAAASRRFEAPATAALPAPAQQHQDRARYLVAALETAAAEHCCQLLGQAEWSAVFQDAQALLDAVCVELEGQAAQMAAAARSAAATVLSGTALGATAPAVQSAMALQLLRKLGSRGLLQQHPAAVPLVDAYRRVLDVDRNESDDGAAARAECRPAELAAEGDQADDGGPAQAQVVAVQLSRTLLSMFCPATSTRGSAAGGADTRAPSVARPPPSIVSDFAGAAEICSEAAVRCTIAVGAIHTLAAAGGPLGQRVASKWRQRSATAALLSELQVAMAAAAAAARRQEEPSSQGARLGPQAAAWRELWRRGIKAADSALQAADVGVDSVDATLSILLDPSPHPQQEAAYLGLLDPSVAPRLILLTATADQQAGAQSDGADGGAEGSGLPDYDGSDPEGFLAQAGLNPTLAQALAMQPVTWGQQRASLSAWALLLAHLQALPPDSIAARMLGQALREVSELTSALLSRLLPLLPLQQPGAGGSSSSANPSSQRPGSSAVAAAVAASASSTLEPGSMAVALRACGVPRDAVSARQTAVWLYRAVLRALPASARTWFGDLRDRGAAAAVEAYTAAAESPALLAAEMAHIQSQGPQYSDDRFSVKAIPANRQVVAILQVEDGAVLELAVRLPPSTPLKAAEVECRRKVGVTDTKVRKWLLSISAFLRNQNRGVADAIELWKKNVDKEFEGVEPCLICYSVISSTNGQLPRLQCRTCAVRFHPACLYKWFKSSGKSACVHCQAPW